MDKNEVLKILETAKDKNGEVPMRLVRQAFEKLPEPCEDTVSRQAAIDAVHVSYDEIFDFKSTGRTVADSVEDIISDLPSAQPERKRGHWIEVDDHYNRISGRCSVCGWESHMYEDDVVGMDFCPNCGCYMGE